MRGRTNVALSSGTAVANGKIEEFTVAEGETVNVGEFVSIKYDAQKEFLFKTTITKDRAKVSYVGNFDLYDMILVSSDERMEILVYNSLDLVGAIDLGKTSAMGTGGGLFTSTGSYSIYANAKIFGDKLVLIKPNSEESVTKFGTMYYYIYKIQLIDGTIIMSRIETESKIFMYKDPNSEELKELGDTKSTDFRGCIFEKINENYLIYGIKDLPYLCLYRISEEGISYVSQCRASFSGNIAGSLRISENKVIVLANEEAAFLEIDNNFSEISIVKTVKHEMFPSETYVTFSLLDGHDAIFFLSEGKNSMTSGQFIHFELHGEEIIEDKTIQNSICTFGFIKNNKLYALCNYKESEMRIIVYDYKVFLKEENFTSLFPINSNNHTNKNFMLFKEDDFKIFYGEKSEIEGFFSVKGKESGDLMIIGDKKMAYKYNGIGCSIGFSKTGGKSGDTIKVYVPKLT